MSEAIICRANSQFQDKTNLAKNWYFINPINSRGKIEYTDYGETIDGWIAQSWYTNNTPKTSFKLTDQGLLITPGADRTVLNQVIDDNTFNFLAGKYVTITIVTSDGDQAVLTLVPDMNTTMEQFKAYFQNRNDYQLLMYRFGGWLGNRPNIQIGPLDGAEPICLLGVCIEIGSESTFTYQDSEGKWRIRKPIPDKSELLRLNGGIAQLPLQEDGLIVNNPYCPYAYEAVVNHIGCNAVGLDTSNGFWWIIKYLPNYRSDGYGIQIAVNHATNKMLFRTSINGVWNPWSTLFHNGNLNPDTIGAAWANHTHDVVAMGGGRIISGSYAGENEYEDNTTKTRFINLGVTPKAVFVMMNETSIHDSNYNNLGGMALQGIPCKTVANNVNYNIIEIVQNGFNVFTTMKRINTNWWLRINTNSLGNTYFYIAFI